MKSVALIGNKGGGGKSLSSILLASEAARRDLSVALIDLDPQGTCEDWASGHEGLSDKPKVKRLPDTQLAAAAGALRSSGCDLLVVDTAPHTEKASVAAARIADLIIIPARPTRADLRAIRFTVDMLKASGSLAKAHVLLNAVSPQGDEAAQASEGIQRAYGIPTLEATLGHRKAFQQALGVGSDPIGWAHGKAADEQRTLVDELFRLLGIGGPA